MTAPVITPDGADLAAADRQAREALHRLSDVLRRRRQITERRLAYYRGRHPLSYASPEFADYFAHRFEGFSDNWCAPVANAPAERLNVLGVRLGGNERDAADDRSADADLTRVWKANSADRGSSEAFVVALAAARAYAMVWGNADDEQTPRITWERPDQAAVAYDPDTGARTWALKLWSGDQHEYATVYSPTEVWKYERSRLIRDVHGGAQTESGLYLVTADTGGWKPREAPGEPWPLPNPIGEVPIVELRNQTLLDDDPLSDIDGVMAMQDAINLVWAYLMNALDYASLPQRIVLGADMPKVPVLNELGVKIGERPISLDQLNHERILWIPSETARTAEWQAANLDVFSSVIERAIEHIAAQTRTPPHYLIGKVANLSAEALTAAETGLVSRVGERTTYFTGAIRDVFRLVALAQGDRAKADAVRAGTVLWADPQHRALGQKVDALLKLKTMGFPFAWLAEQYGLDPTEVTRVMDLRDAEAAADPIGAITELMGQQPPGPDPAPGDAEPAP